MRLVSTVWSFAIVQVLNHDLPIPSHNHHKPTRFLQLSIWVISCRCHILPDTAYAKQGKPTSKAFTFFFSKVQQWLSLHSFCFSQGNSGSRLHRSLSKGLLSQKYQRVLSVQGSSWSTAPNQLRFSLFITRLILVLILFFRPSRLKNWPIAFYVVIGPLALNLSPLCFNKTSYINILQ